MTITEKQVDRALAAANGAFGGGAPDIVWMRAALEAAEAAREPAPGAPEADERARFEAAMPVFDTFHRWDFRRDELGYTADATGFAWLGWQARAQSRAAPVSARDGVMTHRHRQRGTLYREVARGQLQTAEDIGDGYAVVIYVGADGNYWARPAAEFDDGRFERVAVTTPPADARDGEDARRYRWLRHCDIDQDRSVHGPDYTELLSGAGLDAAIDRAMGGE